MTLGKLLDLFELQFSSFFNPLGGVIMSALTSNRIKNINTYECFVNYKSPLKCKHLLL